MIIGQKNVTFDNMIIGIATTIFGWTAVLLFGYAFGYRTALYHQHQKQGKNKEEYQAKTALAFFVFLVLWVVFKFIQQNNA